ncbi:MAG: hypothetical protein GTO71_07825 [Woeseiaceae bacterium]|nr:hypothetical protein [Woeseiaceae bacterium]NIP20996.1 hypothetical protein [Woeseiaceae bacterium]NIS89976.1 hypothetical protein [Woeseiaceae bacterium]
MKGDITTSARSYTTPWTLRAYDALPGNPFWIGIVFTIGLLLVFFVGRSLVDGAKNSAPDDLRVAITHILIMAYSASAYAYLLVTARRTTHDLSQVARSAPHWQRTIDRAGKHPRWILLVVGAASFLVVGVAVTHATTPEPTNPWEWQSWNYEVYWHRATTVLFMWWIGCFCYVTVAESARLSRLSDHIESLDLLDLRPYQPLIRQGLTNALLVFGMVSVLSLLGVESRYGPSLVGSWISFIALAWIGMMLPLRGMRKKIRVAKDQELDWCAQSLKISRDALKSGAAEQQSIAEIMAYRTLIENIRNWPFDSPTLVRFTLYLLIPLGSWLGGAFVERGVDYFLS